MNEETAVKPHIRWMIRRDMPSVMEIENNSFLDDKFDEDEFLYYLKKRQVIGIVAESGDHVIGHALYWLKAERVEIIKMAVHADWRRKHVGVAMMRKIIKDMFGTKRVRVLFPVPAINVICNDFLRAMGFKCDGISDDRTTLNMTWNFKE